MNNTTLLKVNNLEVFIEKKQIISNLNLEIKSNEIHVIMGPNGSGKSTFSKVLAGHPSYMITNGKMELCSKNLLEMSAEVRSHEGIFLAFQYPIEISGVTNYDFLRIAYNEKRKYFNQKEVDPIEFMEIIQKLIEKLKISSEFLTRNLNEGFSGGEKKRNEILQMLLLEPKLIILDEIDSGLDVDALKLICDNIKANFSENSSLLIITHYPKILHYLKPDYIHIMREGKIILTGDSDISLKVEEKGFDYFAL